MRPAFILATIVLALAAEAASGEDGHYIILSNVGQSHAADATRAAGGEVIKEINGTKAVAAHLPEAALRALQRNPSLTVEDDPRRYPLAQTQPYGIASVQADQVADGGGAITVCIIDSGYDLGHEDLPVSGVTFAADGGAGPADEDGCSHGTHVAGTVAAVDNTLGVVGVDPNVGLHIVRVFGDDCVWAYASDLIDAAYTCRDAGANIISMSLGCSGPGPFCSSTLEERVQ